MTATISAAPAAGPFTSTLVRPLRSASATSPDASPVGTSHPSATRVRDAAPRKALRAVGLVSGTGPHSFGIHVAEVLAKPRLDDPSVGLEHPDDAVRCGQVR